MPIEARTETAVDESAGTKPAAIQEHPSNKHILKHADSSIR